MIHNPDPDEWRELQQGVCDILNDIGLAAETEKVLQTPRGQVEIDVFAVDTSSIERIRYLVECKNWSHPIPQTVIHSFTTVMHETGGNIGFIISKAGFQSGAMSYLQNTNILGLTYIDFQTRYFPLWWKNKFAVAIVAASGDLLQYVEPINSRRDRFLSAATVAQKQRYRELTEKYQPIIFASSMLDLSRYIQYRVTEPPTDLSTFLLKLEEIGGSEFRFECTTYRELLGLMSESLSMVSDQFNDIFGMNIFE